MEALCMKCQILFSGENEKNIINLLSAELAQREVKVTVTVAENIPENSKFLIGSQKAVTHNSLWQILLMLNMLGKKKSADNIFKYCSYLSQKTDFGISCKLFP